MVTGLDQVVTDPNIERLQPGHLPETANPPSSAALASSRRPAGTAIPMAAARPSRDVLLSSGANPEPLSIPSGRANRLARWAVANGQAPLRVAQNLLSFPLSRPPPVLLSGEILAKRSSTAGDGAGSSLCLGPSCLRRSAVGPEEVSSGRSGDSSPRYPRSRPLGISEPAW